MQFQYQKLKTEHRLKKNVLKKDYEKTHQNQNHTQKKIFFLDF